MDNPVDIEVIVGGAGVAGLAATAALQQLGFRVTLIEPGLNDERRLAGEVFHPPGVAGLADLGMLSALACEPAVNVEGFSVWSDGECTKLPYDSVPAHRMPGLCLEHAKIRRRLTDLVGVLPNVSIQNGARIVEIEQNDPSCVMVNVENGGALIRYRCQLVVAADGATSRIGRLAGIVVQHRRISTIFGYRISTRNIPQHNFGHVFLGSDTPILVYPIGEDEARILFDVPHRSDRRPSASDCLAMASALPAHLRREVEQVIAVQPRMSVQAQSTRTDRAALGRVVLVGDAGGSCHPLTATGMTMCIRDALMLQNVVAENRNDIVRALQLYQHRRRWPQTTRLVLAEALRDVFCGADPGSRAVRDGMLAYWRDSAAARSATLALLSTADGRPIALLRRIVAVMIRGFLGHVRGPAKANKEVSSFLIASSMLATLYQHVRQVLRRSVVSVR